MRTLKVLLILAVLVAAIGVLPAAAQDDDTKIVVGTNAEYPPFETVDDNDEIVGFDIDLLTALAEDAGFEVEFVNTKWDGIFVALSEGEFDAVISAATITEEREEIIDFTEPYFNAGQTIAVTADLAETVETVEDLVGLRVGVQLGTTGDQLSSELEGVETVRFDEITLAFQALGAGEIDAIINDGPVSADIIANNPDLDAVLVGEPLSDEFYGIAVNPERSDVLDALNLSLENVIASGEYAEIYEEWFGMQPPSMFLPEEETAAGDMMEVDFTDPESVVLGLMNTFFSGDPTVEELLAFGCEGAETSPLFPTEDALAGFAGITADLSKLELVVVEEGDTATITGEGEIGLVVGEGAEPTFMPVDMLLGQLGITQIDLVKGEDGNWLICPAAAE